MDNSKTNPEGPELPGFGIARDVRVLKAHSQASVAELQEFLAQTRGRSPQEVLGMVAGSRLMRSVALATLGAVVVLVAGTLYPYWVYGPPSNPTNKAASAKTVPPPAAAADTKAQTIAPKSQAPQISPAPVPVPASAPLSAPQPTAEAKPNQADAEKAVKVMGLGDTKIADPKTNPMDKKLDNLLDKLE